MLTTHTVYDAMASVKYGHENIFIIDPLTW